MQAYTFHNLKSSSYAANPFASKATPSGNRFSGLVQPLALSEAEKATDKTPPRVSFQLTQADGYHATTILSLLHGITTPPLKTGDTVSFSHLSPIERPQGSLRSSQVTYTHDDHTQTASLLPGPALQLVSLLLKAEEKQTDIQGSAIPPQNYEETLAGLREWFVQTTHELIQPLNQLFGTDVFSLIRG